jgi:hypothetical protein
MSPGVKVSVSCRAERFFKLLALIARKFSKNKGAQHFARTALPALLTLLKLPTSWPLVRLCHKLRLVEPTFSELAGAQEVERSAPALSPFMPRAFAADLPEYASEEDAQNAVPQHRVSICDELPQTQMFDTTHAGIVRRKSYGGLFVFLCVFCVCLLARMVLGCYSAQLLS